MWRSFSRTGRFAVAAVLLVIIIAGLVLMTRQVAPPPSPAGGKNPPAAMTEQPSATPGGANSGRRSAAEAEKLVSGFEFASHPEMNPAATFPVSEITPSDAWERMGVQVFKVSEGVRLGESYIIYQRQVFHIGIAFGGTGINSMAVTDLDLDGTPELVYAYNFGSGIHQSSIGAALIQHGSLTVQDVADFQSTGDFRFQGDLTLVKMDDQTLLVDIVPGGQYETSTMGRVHLIKRRLLWLPTRSDLVLYSNPSFGVSFLYPSVLQQVGQSQRFEGAGYFFELAVLESGSSDLMRSCEWEANHSPYGDQPQVETMLVDGREACLIHTSLNTQHSHDALIFMNQEREPVILRSDPAHRNLLVQTLVFKK